MELSTKKCLLTYAGAIMFAFGFALMISGSAYSNLPVQPGEIAISQIVKAVPHWCGMLLILLGARNFTFGIAQWKYGMNCCGNGACEIVIVNFLALLFSLAAAGLPVYGSWNVLSQASASTIGFYPDFVHLISIWFMSLMCAVLAMLSMCAGCLPVGSPSEEDEVEMQQYGHDNPQFSKY